MVGGHDRGIVVLAHRCDGILNIVDDDQSRIARLFPKLVLIGRFGGFVVDRHGALFDAVGHEEPCLAVRMSAEGAIARKRRIACCARFWLVSWRLLRIALRLVVTYPLFELLIPPDEFLAL